MATMLHSPASGGPTTEQAARPPHLVVLGPWLGLGGLEAHLPHGWKVQPIEPSPPGPDGSEPASGQNGAGGPRPDIVIVTKASGARITAVRRRYPGTPVVGIVDAAAPVDRVVEVLEAGADTCVRSGLPALIASHLRACLRRTPAAG
jgi:hypothetical protein